MATAQWPMDLSNDEFFKFSLFNEQFFQNVHCCMSEVHWSLVSGHQSLVIGTFRTSLTPGTSTSGLPENCAAHLRFMLPAGRCRPAAANGSWCYRQGRFRGLPDALDCEAAVLRLKENLHAAIQIAVH